MEKSGIRDERKALRSKQMFNPNEPALRDTRLARSQLHKGSTRKQRALSIRNLSLTGEDASGGTAAVVDFFSGALTFVLFAVSLQLDGS